MSTGKKSSGNRKKGSASTKREPDFATLTNKEAKKAAKKLGFDKEIKDPPFFSHGNRVFTDGKDMITADRDGHSGGVWKKFDSSGQRVGTFDKDLKRIGG
jgi:hypothetical protein